MAHNIIRTDPDSPQFEINAVTRAIKNNTPTKITLIQHDHNSERFSFVIPRYIEGHDMLECNNVEVHYINIDSGKKAQNEGVYEVDDMAIDAEDENNVLFSWLISKNATKYVGQLNFLIRFSCVQDDGEIDYAWNTAIFSGISVSSGIYNSEDVVEDYPDILAQWKAKIVGQVGEGKKSAVFNDTGNNKALGAFSTASGTNTIAGVKGYYYCHIDFSGNNPVIVLTKEQGVDALEPFEVGYAVGDVISLVNGSKYPNCATITSIVQNIITVDSLPFDSVVWDNGTDDNSFYVINKPTVGHCNLGHYAHAEGDRTQAIEMSSHAEGRQTIAFGQYGHAEGRATQAGYAAHAEGYKTRATKNYAHSEGQETKADGLASHAEGEWTCAEGEGSHAEGKGAIARGTASHVEGISNLATKDAVHVEGYGNIGEYFCQHVQGRYCKPGYYAHIVGNGGNENNRANIHTLDWNGNAWFFGTVETPAIVLRSPDGSRWKVTVNNSGTLSSIKI